MSDEHAQHKSDVLVELRPPTTVSYASGPMERRGRRSGQVAAKPCPGCGAAVAIDPRHIHLVDDREVIACTVCSGRVPVRHSDQYRTAPIDLAEARQRRTLGFGPFRVARKRTRPQRV